MNSSSFHFKKENSDVVTGCVTFFLPRFSQFLACNFSDITAQLQKAAGNTQLRSWGRSPDLAAAAVVGMERIPAVHRGGRGQHGRPAALQGAAEAAGHTHGLCGPQVPRGVETCGREQASQPPSFSCSPRPPFLQDQLDFSSLQEAPPPARITRATSPPQEPCVL